MAANLDGLVKAVKSALARASLGVIRKDRITALGKGFESV
jgi:hypothetical protein